MVTRHQRTHLFTWYNIWITSQTTLDSREPRVIIILQILQKKGIWQKLANNSHRIDWISLNISYCKKKKENPSLLFPLFPDKRERCLDIILSRWGSRKYTGWKQHKDKQRGDKNSLNTKLTKTLKWPNRDSRFQSTETHYYPHYLVSSIENVTEHLWFYILSGCYRRNNVQSCQNDRVLRNL